jgi:hypothetical protein
MNWDDPSARLALIESVGHVEYNRRMDEHHKKSVLETVNGYNLSPVGTMFGRLIRIEGTDKAYRTIEEARTYAEGLAPRVQL